MIYVVWSFGVKPECLKEFEEYYGMQGPWVQFYQRAEGYLGTTLLRNSLENSRFFLWDMWDGISSFEKFKKEFADEFDELDQRCEAFTLEETLIGIFEDL